MTAEQVPQLAARYESFTEYAERTWLNELIRRQNNEQESPEPVFLTTSLQELCAKSLIKELSEKPYFQKFGGNVVQLVMLPTSEPYMYSVGMVLKESDE